MNMNPMPNRTISPGHFVKENYRLLFLSILFLLTYIPTFLWMWERWFVHDSYYTHGILIPFVTCFLIWQKREELVQMKPIGSPLGVPLVISGLLIHLVSSLLRVYFTSGFSFLIVLIGLILYFYGMAILKKIWFPIAFLVFMIPIPEVAIANISFRMKLFAAELATVCLNHMRLPALREGSVIMMRHANITVDDVCSGLRSLIALTALGSIFAYLMTSTLIKKIFLFFSTIPIAIITNIFRIVFLATIAEIWGPRYAQGFIHDLSGFSVFFLAFILLFSVGRSLE